MKRKAMKDWITSRHTAALAASGGVVVLCIAFSGIYFETYALSEKNFPNIAIGSLEIGSLTKEEAREVMQKRIKELQRQGVVVTALQKNVIIPLDEVSLSSDIGLEALSPIFFLDEDKTLDAAYAFGRTGPLVKQYFDRFRSSFAKQRIEFEYTYDTGSFERAAQQELNEFFNEPQPAHFEYDISQKHVAVMPEKFGKKANYKHMNVLVERSLALLQTPFVPLEFIEEKPFPTQKDLTAYLPQAKSFVERKPLLLTFDDNHITLPPSKIVEWLTVEKDTAGIHISLDRKQLQTYLEQEVAPQIDKEAKSIRFEVVNGVPTVLQNPEQGRRVLIDQSVNAIAKALEAQDQQEVELVIQEIDLNEFGNEHLPDIKEIIGTATTNFVGSPKNRKFNITLAAKKIHGVVVEPDEEFSLIKFLGEIDEKSGFLPELVIKGNKTQPEFGGGLCQLSTTVFRAVSQSGLPILERRNHSYRVPYYEPPIGYDATIYYPKPDFRFKNDTENPILIQSGIKGTKITITLWGVKDGRKVEIDAPTVFNRKKPAETKIIETTDLKPGKRKCIERAHEGADAVFERRVTLANGEQRKDIFKSHYVAWPAVCLVGKKAEEKPKDPPQAIEPPEGENPFEEQKPLKQPGENEKKDIPIQEEVKVEKRSDFIE